MRILDPSSARRVPWANGLGTTLELATDAAAPGGEWTWRLSIADVPGRAPFSALPGVDRAIACLEGEGLHIHFGPTTREVPRTGDAFGFAGEEAAQGEPRGPGVRDANLMMRRDRWRGRMTIARGTALDMDAPVVIVHAARAPAPVRVHVTERPGSCLLAEGATVVTSGHVAVPAAPGAVIIACVLMPRASGASGTPPHAPPPPTRW
ncbi:MAG: HutD family protein [Phycisphaerales bacterium]